MDFWLEMENVHKYYHNFHVLRGISFKSQKSGIIGLIGPNGAGKTTLLHILLGLIKRNSGTCNILGHDVWEEGTLLRNKIGVVLEHPAYPTGLTIKDYLNYVTSLYDVSLSDIDYDEWSGRFNLPLNKKISALSAGMRRKMSLIASMISKPEIIILDEPTVNVDPIGHEEILNLILKIHKELNTKFLISSHLLFDIEEITDEILIINDGFVIDSGNTIEIMSKYSQSNEYICTSSNSGDLISILKRQNWVIKAKLDVNRILFTTSNIDPYDIFKEVVSLSKQHNIDLLGINRADALINVFKRLDE